MLSLLHLRASELALCLLRCKLSGPRWLWEASQVARRGRRRCRADPLSLPPDTRPPSQCLGGHREQGGALRKAEGAKGTLRARTWSFLARRWRHPAAPGREAVPWTPWGAGAGAVELHLLRRVQALPLDGRGHWGGRWRARRRGRSLCGSGLAGCRGSDPLGCSGATTASAPFLAGALWRRARPSALKDSRRAPFKRQRERANHRAAGAPRPAEAGTGARSLAPGGCSSSCCCSGLNLPSRSRRRHHHRRRRRPVQLSSRAVARSTQPRGDVERPGMVSARLAAWSPSHLPPGSLRSSPPRAGRGRQPGGGEGIVPLSPGSLLSREGLFSLSFPLSLVSFPFPDHDSNTIEGNHI